MTLTGDNGLLTRTTSAKAKTEQAGIMENIRLAYQNALIGNYVGESESLADKIKTEIETIFGTGTVEEITEENGVYTVTITGYGTYSIAANGNIEIVNGLTIVPRTLALEYFTNKDTQTETTLTAQLQNVEEPVTWNIKSGSDIVSLSSTSGTSVQVTPLKGGTAIIKASAENGVHEDECTITVTEKIAVESIGSLSATDTTVNKGSTITITTPNLTPSTATETLNWESSDGTIATVTPSSDTKSATVSGENIGTAKITVTAANGDNSEINITVVQPVTVTFMNGESTHATENTIEGSTVSNWPTDPTNGSLEFEGWYDAQTGGTKYDSESTISEDKTLYARWKVVSIAPSIKATTNSSLTMTNTRGEIEVVWLSGSTNEITSTANTPNVQSGMTSVTWSLSGNSWVEDSPTKSTWYNYNTTDKQWANVKDTVGSYFVWIPRFAYRITYYDSNNQIVGYYDGHGLWTANGNSKREFSDIVATNEVPETGKTYIVHNAFLSNANNGGGFGTAKNTTTGEDGITGLWVAKYEMCQRKSTNSGSSWTDVSTSSSSIGNVATVNSGETRIIAVSKPGVASWRNINIANCYTNSKNYGTQIYNSATVNSHLMKNSEWGAVAYLAHSQYGLNGANIAINNSSTYITGKSAGTSDAASSATNYDYNDKTNGVKASTTGNIYGIYDLSGGAYEYVAAFNKNYSGDYFTGTSYKDAGRKHFASYNGASDAYATAYSNSTSTSSGTSIYTVGITGDATKEVYTNTQVSSYYRNWNTDYSLFVNSSNPFFLRGGYYDPTSSAGLFFSYYYSGYANGFCSFRVVLAP